MTRFFVHLLTLSLIVAGAVTLVYRFPERIPPQILPYLAAGAARFGLPPVVVEVQAAPQGARQGAGAPGRGGRPVAVEASPVKIERVRITINAVGSLLANEQVTIAPELAGRVAEIRFEEGQPVNAGDALVLLDDTVLKADLASAQAALKLAQANFERADTLLRQSAGTQRARDEAVSSLESGRAAVDLAKARLDKAAIRAPFAGILGLREVSVGEYVNAGVKMETLQNIDPIKVDFRIPETYLANVRVGQKLGLTIDALPGQTFEGEIYAIDPQVDVNGRAIKLRARVPNPTRDLKPGLFSRVEIVATSRDEAVIVPESAIVPIGDQRYVYVLRDNKAVRTPVSIGHRLAGEVEVTAGLKKGDLVVTTGHQRLRDGVGVEIVTANAKV